MDIIHKMNIIHNMDIIHLMDVVHTTEAIHTMDVIRPREFIHTMDIIHKLDVIHPMDIIPCGDHSEFILNLQHVAEMSENVDKLFIIGLLCIMPRKNEINVIQWWKA